MARFELGHFNHHRVHLQFLSDKDMLLALLGGFSANNSSGLNGLETFCFAPDSRVVVYKMLACCMLRRGNDSTAIHTESKQSKTPARN